jgi:hypothetical protein
MFQLVLDLESEKRKNQDAQREIEELENIIAIQKQLIDERSRSAVEFAPLLPPHVPTSVGSLTAIENSVSHEDKGMWPSIMTILDEMLEQLRILGNRNDAIRTDANLRAAIAMAFRIKTSLPAVESSVSSVASVKILPGGKVVDAGSVNSFETQSSSLQQLSQHVKRLETELSEIKVPERHMSVLRGLTGQVEQLKEAASRDMDKRASEWENERASLMKEIENYRRQMQEISALQGSSADSIKMRYDAALEEAQDALEQQTSVSRAHIEHLNEVIQQTQNRNIELKAQLDLLEMQIRDQKPTDNVLALKRMVQTATEESEQREQTVKEIQDYHNREISQLKDHFSIFRSTQEGIIQSLEKQLRDRDTQQASRHDNASESSGDRSGNHADRGSSLRSAAVASAEVTTMEEKYRRLEAQYSAKCDELNVVLRRLEDSVPQGMFVAEEIQRRGNFAPYDHAESVSSLAEDETADVDPFTATNIRVSIIFNNKALIYYEKPMVT